jgi:hypothetical protein
VGEGSDSVRRVLAVLLDSFGYRLMVLAHITSAIVAFGPTLLYPSLRRAGATQAIAATHTRMTFPALVVLWVLGMGLAGMSEGAYEMKQTWLALSIVNWLVLVGVSWFVIRPAITDTSQAARARLAAGVGVTHVGLVIGLALMIWKPGL